MRILITGADGFIGRTLVKRLLADANSADELILVDRQFSTTPDDFRTNLVQGDITDSALLEHAVGDGADQVFHLASLPGGAAEADFELGLRVNLQATLGLLETLRRRDSAPRLVLASTIAVYGSPMPDLIDETTVPEPAMSYGAHKLMSEVLLADYSRRGHVDGVALRLPGIVARPSQGAGMLSLFMSDLIRDLAAGKEFVCPVPRDGIAWWMSRPCAVGNLLHAAALPAETLSARRAWLLPVLRASMGEVTEGIGRAFGVDVSDKVAYRDDNPQLQAQFASFPALRCPCSEAAGFRHDGSIENLVRRALEP